MCEAQEQDKIKFMTQHKTQWKMPMYACSMNLTNLEEIYPIRPMSWDEILNCMFPILGGQHTTMAL